MFLWQYKIEWLISKLNFSLFRTTLDSCFGYFSHSHDKVSDKSKSMKGLSCSGFVGTVHHGMWWEQGSHYITVRKQRQMTTVAQPALPIFIHSGPEPTEWWDPHFGWVFHQIYPTQKLPQTSPEGRPLADSKFLSSRPSILTIVKANTWHWRKRKAVNFLSLLLNTGLNICVSQWGPANDGG